MTDVLARIVERKRREVAARLPNGPVAAEPTRRSLRHALSQPGARFIMEVKRASPSGHRSEVSVEQAARAYAPVADAISVLTDGADFGGSIADIGRVRQVFDGPILAKDFIVAPAQVSEARAAGADAVLVMMSVLDDESAAAVLAEARRLAMDAIIEVHDEAELDRALALDARIVGINNRDLKTLRTDLAVTRRLAGLVPDDVLVISESGVSSRADVELLARHANAFLVGSALMAAPDVAQAARALVNGRVKLCGLTRPEDVDLAARSGATHAGFVMVDGTPRAIDPGTAQPLVEQARRLGLRTVGVFRDRPTEELAQIAAALKLDAVQMHGSEDDTELAKLGALLPDLEVWDARGVDDEVPAARKHAHRSLFDSRKKGSSGGTGEAFEWSLLSGCADLSEAFLAGGIGPDNALRASRVGAYGLDVGSAVEASPGVKDEAKVAALFAALRLAARGDDR